MGIVSLIYWVENEMLSLMLSEDESEQHDQTSQASSLTTIQQYCIDIE